MSIHTRARPSPSPSTSLASVAGPGGHVTPVSPLMGEPVVTTLRSPGSQVEADTLRFVMDHCYNSAERFTSSTKCTSPPAVVSPRAMMQR